MACPKNLRFFNLRFLLLYGFYMGSTAGQAVINLTNVTHEGREGDQLSISITKTGVAATDVNVIIQVFGYGNEDPELDVIPKLGNVTFFEGETSKDIVLTIIDDLVPEEDEQFMVRLIDVQGGQSVHPGENRPFIDQTAAEKRFIIRANDAPIRFQQELYRVTEEDFQSFLRVVVLRGQNANSTFLGPTNKPASASYYIKSKTAQNGEDFIVSNGTVNFAPGTTSAVISVDVLSDDIPEISESLEIVLNSVVGDVVIKEPSRAEIIINANDDYNGVLSFQVGDNEAIAPFTVRVNEDVGSRIASFVVLRIGGAFGVISIEWTLTTEDGWVLQESNSVTPSGGVLMFADGVREQTIIVTLIEDTVPEASERYYVTLLENSVIGGGRAEGSLNTELILEDSDLAHGVIQFTSDSAQTIVTTASPRRLAMTLTRGGGTLGNVNVFYTAAYMHSTSTSAQPIFMSHFPAMTTMATGKTSHTFDILIREEAFLRVEGYFTVVIDKVELAGEPSVGPFNSPLLGSKVVTSLPVTDAVANGEIELMSIETQRYREPDLGSTAVSIAVKRIGTNGAAIIYWQLRGSGQFADHVTVSDVQPMDGVLSMAPGQSTANVLLEILSDNLAETEEQMTLTLTRVDPETQQQLRPGSTEVKLIIEENDNAGGTFQFSSDMSSSYFVREEQDPIQVQVVRTGGALVLRQVECHVTPGGEQEFYGATTVLRFEPGVTHKSFTLLARHDGVPEIAEEFTLHLRSFADSPREANIGVQNRINITVAENEQPYGRIEFELGLNVFVGESTANSSVYALVPVRRAQGRFSTVSVDWFLAANESEDLAPSEGTLYFQPGVGEAFIEILVLPDDLPEEAETFEVRLRDATNGAELGETLSAQITVQSNDDAVYFADSEPIKTEEGSSVTLTVRRDGNASEPASVKYRLLDGTATRRSFDFLPVKQLGVESVEDEGAGLIEFEAGQVEVQIMIDTLDDEEPETDETFYVLLFEPIGDTAVFKEPQATIVITANDQANGVFSFASPLNYDATEGNVLELILMRAEGPHSEVHVYYEILDSSGTAIEDGVEFENSSGVVVFEDLQGIGYIELVPVADGVPEYAEDYLVVLVNVTGGGPSGQTPLLAEDNLVATVTIRENDDPHGVFAFSESSREVNIAEDYPDGQQNWTRAVLTVERRQGTFGEIKVAWEVFSYQIAGAGNLPPMIDLMLVGQAGAGIEELPWLRRSSTGTDVFGFDGCKDCFMEVAPADQPPVTDIADGFALSVWLQALRGADGYVLAKTSRDGLRHHYAVRVKSEVRKGQEPSAVIEFRYSVPGTSENQMVSRTMTVNLEAGWHHIVLNVHEGLVQYFVDGADHGTSELAGQLQDGEGVLYVGARAGPQDHFEGVLQDLRFFSRKLELGEIHELFETPSMTDITPISGILTFPEGVSRQDIRIDTRQDGEEEADDVFSVRLIATSAARVSQADATSLLTVLKSDNANGLFSLADDCTPSLAAHENSTFTCVIQRERGDSGGVEVTWHVIEATSGGGVAEQDFVNASGVVYFAPGDREQILTITANDDEMPEITENFTIVLASVSSTDGAEGTTPTSGASLEPASSSSNISLPESDYPYGLFQFSENASMIPRDDEERIPPATQQPVVHVQEEAGHVTLLVMRAQGVRGHVTVEWRTRDGSARSFGKTFPDYVADVGQLSFTPGERYKLLNITLLDNSIPESDKFFTVELLNPAQGAETSPYGGVVRVEIGHSDFAHGVFGFHKNTVRVLAEETSEMQLNVAKFIILREGGNIGPVNVTWRVTSDAYDDVTSTEGVSEFADGQSEADVRLVVRQDSVPELDESFAVSIIHVTSGVVGEAQSAELIIAANDDPYGVFVIANHNRLLQAVEGDAFVEITIERSSTSGAYGDVLVSYTTLAPSESYAFLPGTLSRADTYDYSHTSGSVLFTAGVRVMTFNVTLLADDVAEIEESVFVILASVELDQGEQEAYVPNSPRLGPSIDTYAQIVIAENDDAHGVLQVSVSRVTVSEESRELELHVIRSDGAYGTVSVKFEVIQGTATYGLDYSVTSQEVILDPGQTQQIVPIEILNDALPEVSESLAIRLLDQISGGARLGSRVEAKITIEASDDPNGAFGFESAADVTREPGSGEIHTVSIPVVRVGGTLGVVSVDWTATLQGALAADDVTPASGTVLFVSNSAREMLMITILPDSLPEGIEDIQITLVNASGGGRVIPARSIFTLSILANDNPHGTVSLAQNTYIVIEPEEGTVQYVPLARSGGVYGQLRVYYAVQELDIMNEISENGETVFEYFEEPMNGKPLPLVGTKFNVKGQPEPLKTCASLCLLSRACAAFDYNANRVDCNWFSSTQYDSLDARTGYVYYEKDSQKSDALYASQATATLDFTPVQRQALVIQDGDSEGLLPVQITPDTYPEIPERFRVSLLQVELIGDAPSDPDNIPLLGNVTSSHVIISSNDAAHGVLRMCAEPPCQTGSHVIEVQEREKLAVEFIVERRGGSIGTVSVSWRVLEDSTTATRGADYVADGATLVFEPGVTQRAITVSVEEDTLPENTEQIILELHNPQGGAVLDTRDFTRATLSILANDHVAGLLGFFRSPYLAREGDVLSVRVLRTAPAMGIVTSQWRVQAVGESQPPEQRFRTHTGTLFFDEGETEKQIVLHVLVDNEPKVNQEYHITLHDVTTEGIGETGAAAVDPDHAITVVTIQGGNDPHGVFSFSPVTQQGAPRVEEAQHVLHVPVQRKFGAIGSVRLHYEVKPGSLTPTGDLVEAALPDLDFNATTSHVIVYDGESSITLPVHVIDDVIPEIDEVFLVQLLSVELLQANYSTFAPRLANTDITSEVIIDANDGTQGEVVFAEDYTNITVSERRQDVTLILRRMRGTFGSVSVFCFAQNNRGGATRGEDFNFSPRDIYFGAGVSEQVVVIEILEDTLPEPAESFEIVLASPKNGLTIGSPGAAIITIEASDEASGVVSIAKSDDVMLVEPSDVTDDMGNSRAYVTLVRSPGIHGEIQVPFSIRQTEGGSEISREVDDLSPSQGVVVFADQQDTAILEVHAVADDIPEEAETFILSIHTPEGGATLGEMTTITLVVERNDAPYGALAIYPSGTRNSSITVEEADDVLYFDVIRSSGSLGWIRVDLMTSYDTARSMPGEQEFIGFLDKIREPSDGRWCSFAANEWTFMLLMDASKDGTDATDNHLYLWQGSLIDRQTFVSSGGSSCESFTLDGVTYVVITDPGQEGNRDALTRVYEVTQDALLTEIQELTTKGASSSAFYTHGNKNYLFVANRENSAGDGHINSHVYEWDMDNTRFRSSPVEYIPTNGAVETEILHIESEIFLLVLNHYDTSTTSYEINSVLYLLDTDSKWNVHQQIPTTAAIDSAHFTRGPVNYLVIANQRDDSGRYDQSAHVLVWSDVTRLFERVQSMGTIDAQDVEIFTYKNMVYLALACKGTTSSVYHWHDDQAQFVHVWSGARATSVQAVVMRNEGEEQVAFLVFAEVSNSSVPQGSSVYQMSVLDPEADYMDRHSTLWFSPGQQQMQVAVKLLDDSIPEGPESFTVRLANPRQGAELDASHDVTVHILTNDNGHGIIRIAQDSLQLYVEETESRDNMVTISVARDEGSSGHVIVEWRLTGEHNGVYDISPVEGVVEFLDGQTGATISLSVLDDALPELDELSTLTLTRVVQSGSALPDRGAMIGAEATSKIIVMANDSPYGVVAWETLNYVTTEPEASDSIVTMRIIREQGTLGDISVSYMTTTSATLTNQAMSGKDFVTSQQNIQLAAGVNAMDVEIVILADSDPEIAETFQVNITAVQLLGGQAQNGVGPSVNVPHRLATVTILENDDARGRVQFDVIRNAENRVDTYEGSQPLQLRVKRSVAYFGDIEVTWMTSPREAQADDFSPSRGVIRFEDRQTVAFIDIDIADDDIPENLETFEVTFTRVTSGGAALGTDTSVRVSILKNDSPNGVFSFRESEVYVSEATSSSDPAGSVRAHVVREGTSGHVTVQWRLEAAAANDFLPPLAGSVVFQDGEFEQSLTLHTAPDSQLEGEERFTLSLISADNNADIAPGGEADIDIVVRGDAEASGRVRIVDAQKPVYIGEPSAGYDGVVSVELDRGIGIYGAVDVTWQLVPRDVNAFVLTQGVATFQDLQQTSFVLLQARDNSIPQLRATFTMELTSATGGATIADDAARMRSVVYAASDYPHGLFEFEQPEEINVQEDQGQVTLRVIRHYGQEGSCTVFYTTVSASASDMADFRPISDSLTFTPGQSEQTISVDIFDDVTSEGPEMFHVNLTRVELVFLDTNNYTVIEGVQLDMAPDIGPLAAKTIIIEKNDNAEGTVQFTEAALQMSVLEDAGTIQVPIERTPGTFGHVIVQYSLHPGTADLERDVTVTSPEAEIQDGDSEGVVSIVIIDDLEREFAEHFTVVLDSVSSGAKLGRRTTANVTILKSDYPNGKISFIQQGPRVIENPTSPVIVPIAIERTGGGIGTQTVFWRIMGPNNPNRVLLETNDVSVLDAQGQERVQGQVQWLPDDFSSKSFSLRIKPYTGWEIEKTFIVMVSDIQGFPADLESAEIDPAANNFTLVVKKHGDPNGIVQFDGLAQVARHVTEPASGALTVLLPLLRTEGTTGDVQVHWRIESRSLSINEPDIDPIDGVVTIAAGRRDGQIELRVLADDIPEVNETFHVVLSGVMGGAEISTRFNTSLMTIRFNDAPHGRFGLVSELQTVVVTSSMQRRLRLNITREAGALGRVRIGFRLRYDQAQAGVSYIPSSGSVMFNDSQAYAIVHVHLEPDVYLASGSTFTATLTSVTYIGADVTESPELVAEAAVVKVTVPDEAANSRVGFQHLITSVDEETGLSEITVVRHGTYGDLQVSWKSGYPEGQTPIGFTSGSLVPEADVIMMKHGQEKHIFYVRVTRSTSEETEIFSMHLLNAPVSSAGGGARLLTGATGCQIEPHGVLGFHTTSRDHMVEEGEGQDVQVTLRVERMYGSLGSVQVRYSTHGGTALEGVDYVAVQSGSLTLANMQSTAELFITIKADDLPETNEQFFVNLTSVTLLPTDTTQSISPRISDLHHTARVTISSNSDPYGVLSLETKKAGSVTEPGAMELIVRRTKGVYGEVRARVRTVGGGEAWDNTVGGAQSSQNSHTIGQVLANRNPANQAVADVDYQIIDTIVVLKDGDSEAGVTLYTQDDTSPEDDEVIFVYITSLTEGVRIAHPSHDEGRKGFVEVRIERNDFWSGWLGFLQYNSSVVTASEDLQQPARLTLERRNASFGDVQVYWRAVLQKGNDIVQNNGVDLSLELTSTTGQVTCASNQRFCSLEIPLVQDTKPENSTVFYVELTRVSSGGDIDPQRKFATVTMEASDFPNGLVQFHVNSRHIFVDPRSAQISLTIEKSGYLGKSLVIDYKTEAFDTSQIMAGITVYNAIANEDFPVLSRTLPFQPNERTQEITFDLDLSSMSLNPFPKAFRVLLTDVSNEAELGVTEAVVTLVGQGQEGVWQAWAHAQQPLDNATIDTMLVDLLVSLGSEVDDEELALTQSVLDTVLDVAHAAPLLPGTRGNIMDVFCRLLRDNKNDASRGHWQLAQQLERFAFSQLQPQCSDPGSFIQAPKCPLVSFRVAKWYPEDINGFKLNIASGDFIQLPGDFMSHRLNNGAEDENKRQCYPIVFVEYSSEQWFDVDRDKELLNARVITVSVLGETSREIESSVKFRIHTENGVIAHKNSKCVYFDEYAEGWSSGKGICDVTNNLDLAIDDYVDCSCKHMSHYAVRIEPRDPDKIGYPIWFHVSCFIAMAGFLAVVICHQFCAFRSLFSANLIMHMCSAVFATELCYVISAFLSPGHILDINPQEESNYRCIIMSLFTHYFFLAQFTWILTQSLNFYRILILNDEHTDRKYMQYFLVGWGLPAIIIFIFYVTCYLLYRFVLDLPADEIYGDVHQNGDICFITEPLAGLAGVIVPVLCCLLVVGIVFVQAYQVAPQWQAYDDVYRGRYNLHEIRVLLLLWACLCVTWLWGGLHLAYSHVAMLVLFCLFNIATGLFASIAYAALRNPCAPCLRTEKDGAYSINAWQSNLTGQPYEYKEASLRTCKESLSSGDQDTWDRNSLTRNSTLRVRRAPVTTRTTDMPPGVYLPPATDPVPPPGMYLPPGGAPDSLYGLKPDTQLSRSSSITSTRDTKDSAGLDDLIYALKSRSLSPSETSHYDTDPQGHYSIQGHGEVNRRSRPSPLGTFPQSVRKTKHSVVDTHF